MNGNKCNILYKKSEKMRGILVTISKMAPHVFECLPFLRRFEELFQIFPLTFFTTFQFDR